MAKYGCRQYDGEWYVTKDDELYIQCSGETVAWLIAKSLNLEADNDEENVIVTDLAVRLYRYSEKTLAELTDPDFAEAVQKAIKLLTGKTGDGMRHHQGVVQGRARKEEKEKMTNAEKIRAMEDDKLAEFLCQATSNGEINCDTCIATDHCWIGHNGFRDWLKLEAKDG